MTETTKKAAPKRAETQYVTKVMDDGRTVDFAGKRKMLKEGVINEDGSLAVRLDFVNGETRIVKLNEALLEKFAIHGAEQKLGDEIAGLDDVEDCVMAIDELMDRLDRSEWTVKREVNGLAGSSVLAKALVEKSGKPIAAIKEFLKTKTQAEKVALRNNPAIAPIIARLEAEKVKKPSTIDTDSLLGELENGTPLTPTSTGVADGEELAA